MNKRLLGSLALVGVIAGVVLFVIVRDRSREAGPGSEALHQDKPLRDWLTLLKTGSPTEQSTACLALQYFPVNQAAAAVADLTALLEAPDDGVRGSAAYALCHLGPAARAALPALAKHLADPNLGTRTRCAEALDELCDPRDGALVGLLHRALRTAMAADGKVEVVRSMRIHSTRALGKIGPEAAVAVADLTSLLDDPDQYVRWAGVEALGGIGPGAKASLDALTRAQKDADSTVRVAASLALWRVDRSPTAVGALLTEFAQRRDRYQPIAAAEALSWIGPDAKAAVPALLEAAKNDTTPGVNGRYEVRAAAARALRAIDPAAASRAGID